MRPAVARRLANAQLKVVFDVEPEASGGGICTHAPCPIRRDVSTTFWDVFGDV
jgi:hypothetical protein